MSKIGGVISGALAARAVSRHISDRFISKRINDALDGAKATIAAWYADYLRNVCFFAAINAAILLLVLIPHFFFSINDAVIVAISALTIVMMARFVYTTIRNIVRIRPHLGDVAVFLIGLRDYKSLPAAIREFIRYKFRKLYFDRTNGAGRLAHAVFSTLGFVKTTEDIEGEVMDGFYRLIRRFLIGNIVYRIAAVAVFYSLFAFLLKPLVFSHAMGTSVLLALFYPLTIALPSIVAIVRGGA